MITNKNVRFKSNSISGVGKSYSYGSVGAGIIAEFSSKYISIDKRYYSTFNSMRKHTIMYKSTSTIILKRGMKKGTEGIIKTAAEILSKEKQIKIPKVSPNTSPSTSPSISPQISPRKIHTNFTTDPVLLNDDNVFTNKIPKLKFRYYAHNNITRNHIPNLGSTISHNFNPNLSSQLPSYIFNLSSNLITNVNNIVEKSPSKQIDNNKSKKTDIDNNDYIPNQNQEISSFNTIYTKEGVITSSTSSISTSTTNNIPLPEPIKPILYLPLTEYFENISGLATLDSNFRDKFANDKLFAQSFSKFFLLEHMKIIIYLLQGQYDPKIYKKQLAERIFKCFSLIQTKDMLDNNSFLKEFYLKKYVSSIQHILNLFCHYFNIPLEDFKDLISEYKIDLYHYKKIPISVIIEYFIFKQNIQLFDSTSIVHNIKFVDHNNPMFNKVTPQDKEDLAVEHFLEHESMEQTGQRRSDLLLYTLTPTSEGIKIDKVYRDVKADYKGTTKGHFTIKPFLFTDYDQADKYMNNYISTLKAKSEIYKNSMISMEINKNLNILMKIKNEFSNKKFSIKQSILDFNKIILDMSLDSFYIDLDLNFTVATDINIDEDFITHTLPQLEKIIQDNVNSGNNIFDINVFFPQSNQVSKYKYNEKMLEMINIFVPEHLRANFMSNYKKFIKDNDDTK